MKIIDEAQEPSQEQSGRERSENERAAKWLRDVYQGDKMPQLTVRAVVTGMLLGGVMSLSNLYVGMKTGWGLGVTITACILAFAIFSSWQALIQTIFPNLHSNHFSILENNMMSSSASAAGYMSSIFVSAIPALYMATGRTLGWIELMLWALAVSLLGVFMAIPMKRQQINIEQLPFPSGIATAETLQAMHAGGSEAKRKASALAIAALIGAVVAWFRSACAPWIPKLLRIPEMIGPAALKPYTFGLELSTVMFGAGAIMGIRVATWMMVASIFCYGVLDPWVVEQGWVPVASFRSKWALWPGVGLMVSAGLTSFAIKWKTVARSFSSIGRMFGGNNEDQDVDPIAHLEAPDSWFVWGVLGSGAMCVVLGMLYFNISWWMGIIAVIMTFFLALIASRATGETDITPTGAMGKITQLTFGALAPSNITTNLMTASITGGAAVHTADLLTDLKSGYILGANPRKQLIAQLFGVLSGTFFTVAGYKFLFADQSVIGKDAWPAPAATTWAGVAKLLSDGIDALPKGSFNALLIASILGVIIALFEEFTPKKYRMWVPSSTAIGLAFVVPAFNSISMFLGALVAWILSKTKPEVHQRYTVAASSGLIAGETIIALVVAALAALAPHVAFLQGFGMCE